MIFPNRTKNTSALTAVGMMFLVIGITFPYFVHPTAGLGLNLLHLVRGMLFGISIALNLGSVILAGRQRQCGGSPAAK